MERPAEETSRSIETVGMETNRTYKAHFYMAGQCCLENTVKFTIEAQLTKDDLVGYAECPPSHRHY